MIQLYLKYKSTGEIIGWETGLESPGVDYILSETGLPDDGKNYVKDGKVIPRPSSKAILSGLTLKNLPAPCKIIINSTSYDCSDTTATLSMTYPMTYKILVRAFPTLDAEFTVTV